MSRAFVKEQDGGEPLVRPEPELPPGTKNHITPAGAARFRERLAETVAERARLGEGGLAEARRQELEAEARWLERRLATFVETPPPEHPVRVGFGTGVTVEGERGQRKLSVVGVDEVDPATGAISWLSPMARALLGAAVGEVVTVSTPAGDEEWEILELEALTGRH
jgi:transcription elongation factor GreB